MAQDAPATTQDEARGGGETLYTLTEVSKKTGISMPTLQRYKKNYQDRIPSVGKGRKQRYPERALPIFEELKKENVKRRGRPPKGGAKRERPAGATAKKSAARKELLPLTQIAEETGISYPTLVRYVKLYGDQIPSEGTGRKRRYHPDAIEVFKRLRAESPRGRRKKAERGRPPAAPSRAPAAGGGGNLDQRVASLERTQAALEREIRELVKQLRKPLKVTIDR
ncbi:MAG: hypothetical protein ACLF0P_10930 [Thermoanaerobaculia bacterium]